MQLSEKKLSEDALCGFFADKLISSRSFMEWVLSRTSFAEDAPHARLLNEEQDDGRVKWWRHWWIAIPDLRHSETDIFTVFERPDRTRFALHIENKLAHSKWTHADQARTYAVRAKHMSLRQDKGNYRDWNTVLLAPRSFIGQWPTEAQEFDSLISHEEVAEHVPEFQDGRRLPSHTDRHR